MKISSFTASSCFLQATLQSRSLFRPELSRRPCWSSKGRVRKNGHKNSYLIPPTPPLPHLGVWTNYFLPSELKRIYVVIRSQIIMNSITAPQKTFSNHSTGVNQIIIKSGYEDHLSFRADGFGRIFKAPGEHLDKMEWNESKCIHTQIKYEINMYMDE